jgi:hypothetical protein
MIRRLLLATMLTLVVSVAVKSLPDLVRYLKIREM